MRAFFAMCGALPSLFVATFVVWVVMDAMVGWVFKHLFVNPHLASPHDVTKIGHAYRLGAFGTFDVLRARLHRAVDRTFANWTFELRVVLLSWGAMTAFAQTYFSIAVSRRAGDRLPTRSNLLHALRRAPRVFAAWSVVLAAVFAIVFVPATVVDKWSFWAALPATVVAELLAVALVTRTCFVVPIAVAEDDLIPGLGWAQCLVLSWKEVQGRTVLVFVRIVAVCAVPLAIVGGFLQMAAFGEGATAVGLDLAIATEFAIATVAVAVFVGAASALYCTDYRYD